MSTQPEVLKTLRANSMLNKVHQGNKRVHMFNVDFTEYDPEFVGKFVVHYPSQLERLQIGVVKSSLLGGLTSVDVKTDNIALIISTLDTVTDLKPDWFDVDNPAIEYEILEAVFTEYAEWVDSFRKRTKADTSKGTSQNEQSKVPVVDTEDLSGTSN